MSDETKKKMKLFGYFTAFNQLHCDLKSKMSSYVYDNINKLDPIDQQWLIDIMSLIDKIGDLYNDQITGIASIINDEITSSRINPRL